VATAELSIAYADQTPHERNKINSLTDHADAMHAAGRRGEAERLFTDAEQRQKTLTPTYPLLYSRRGYQYCDLLLANGQIAVALDRAIHNLQCLSTHYPLVDAALDTLTIGRAYFGLALEGAARQTARYRPRRLCPTCRGGRLPAHRRPVA
jgi:hypothetical protein